MLGVVAVTWRRRALVLGGGGAFAAALGAAASAPSFWVLLVAFSVLYPASGAFVSLSQASLMDLDPDRREQNMARWTVAGSLGAVTGPLLLVTFALVGVGWRGILAGLALLALGLVFLVHRAPEPSQTAEERPRLRDAVQAIRSREVFRWLFLLELSDLLLDVFLGFLALYVVDVVGGSPATGGLAVAVWTGAGLAGSLLMIPLLERVDGLRYLRASALATVGLFAAFVVVPGVPAKLALIALIALANAGWYPVLKARLYGALRGHSGLVLSVGALFPLNAVLPLGIAAVAERWGLGVALWPLLAAPVALVALVPRGTRPTPPTA